MGYNSAIKTAEGIELLSRVLAGETKMMFTKMATSEKPIEEFEIKQQLVPMTKKDTSQGMCRVILDGLFSNVNLSTGYKINVIALYAKDDNDNEVMVSYLTPDEEGPAELNPYNGEVPQIISFSIYSGVSVNDSTIIIVNPEGMATQQFVIDYINSEKELVVDTENWTTETGVDGIDYYTKTFSVQGIKSTDRPLLAVKVITPTNVTLQKQYDKQWTPFFGYDTGNNSILLKTYKIPTSNFEITIKGVG